MRHHAEDDKFLYTVGWLDALRIKGDRKRRLSREWRYARQWIKDRNWRALKNQFNGWMYEPSPWPEAARRCGTGWTKQRAIQSFYRYLDREVS